MLAWFLALQLAVVHVWMLSRFSVNFPFQDDFTQLLAVPGYFDRQSSLADKISYLFSLSVEHRIATLRLIALTQAKWLGGFQFQILQWVGNLMAVLAAALLVSRAIPWQRAWLALLATALVFSPANYIAQYWTTGALQHFGLIFYAIASLYFISRRDAASQLASVLLAAAAAFTAANGLFVFPIGTCVQWWMARRRLAIFWLCLTFVFFSAYFIGYEPPAGRTSALAAMQHPVRLVIAWAAALGSMTGEKTSAVFMGIAVMTAWLLLARRAWKREIGVEWVAWAAFMVCSAASIAAGRLPWGEEAVLNSRYRIYSEMAVVVTVAAASQVLGRRRGLRLLWWLAPFSLIWFAQGWEAHLPLLADLSTRQRNALERYAINGHGIYYEFPPQDFGDFLLRRTRDENQFNPTPESLPQTFVEVVNPATGASSPPPARVMPEAPIVAPGTISIRGTAPAAMGAVFVWLKRSDGAHYRGSLGVQRLYRRLVDDEIVFWGTISTSGLVAGRYRVGYSDTETSGTEVAWTDDWIVIN